MSLIQIHREGSVATIVLNRPEAMNAFSLQMMDEFAKALDEIHFDTSISAVIIAASEGKGFCSGADLKERATMDEMEVRRCLSKIRKAINAVEALPMPTIAAVNGYAFGGGTELALACDIRILSERAVMGLTETSLGIIPGGGGTQRLPRIVGRAKAKELIFTSRRIKAEEALEIGLANKVVIHEELLAQANAMGSEIAQNGPIALRAAKKAIDKGIEVDLASGLAFEISCYELTIPTEDRVEGLTAFREKRKPVYKGK
jgi:methylglutaconyl-CoA hydratase